LGVEISKIGYLAPRVLAGSFDINCRMVATLLRDRSSIVE